MNHSIEGVLTRLEELSADDAADVLRIRNNPENNRFLSNAGQEIKLEDQIKWTAICKEENDNVNFKVLVAGKFAGTISLYDIDENGVAEFGRYIITHPIGAIEGELLLLKYGFETLGLTEIWCKTVKKNTKVWQQHDRVGFKTVGSDVDERINEERVLQVFTSEMYKSANFDSVMAIINRFK